MGTVTRDDYAIAFATQAKVDFESHVILMNYDPPVVTCQHLHFLQMACEKLCKAHYYSNTGPIPKDISSSHAHVASRLPIIIRDMLNRDPAVPNGTRSVILRGARDFSREIELFALLSMLTGRGWTTANTLGSTELAFFEFRRNMTFQTFGFLKRNLEECSCS